MYPEELSFYTCSTLLLVNFLQQTFYLNLNAHFLSLKHRQHVCKYKSSRPVVYKKGVMKKPIVISDEEEIVACCSRFVGYFMMYQ